MNTSSTPTPDSDQTIEVLGISVLPDRIANPKIRRIIADRTGKRSPTANYTEHYKETHEEYHKYDKYDKHSEYDKYDKIGPWGLWREAPPAVQEAPKCNAGQ